MLTQCCIIPSQLSIHIVQCSEKMTPVSRSAMLQRISWKRCVRPSVCPSVPWLWQSHAGNAWKLINLRSSGLHLRVASSFFLWNQLACGRRGTTFARASNDTAASKNGENRYISKRYKRGIQLQWKWPIGNGIRAFEWYQFRWPSITMSDYIAHHMCYS